MISFTEAKKILNKGERKYTDEEVKEIRDYLYKMAELQIETEKKKMEHAALLKDNADTTQ